MPPAEAVAEASPPDGDLVPSAPRVAPDGQAPAGTGGQGRYNRTAGNRDPRSGLGRAAPDAPTAVAYSMRGVDEQGRPVKRDGRWEFVGIVAEEPVRKMYIERSVASYFPKGNQNPVKYVSCDE